MAGRASSRKPTGSPAARTAAIPIDPGARVPKQYQAGDGNEDDDPAATHADEPQKASKLRLAHGVDQEAVLGDRNGQRKPAIKLPPAYCRPSSTFRQNAGTPPYAA